MDNASATDSARSLLALANRAAALAGRWGWDVDALIATAQRATGLSDLDRSEIAEPLGVLLRAYEETADLSALGRLTARWDIVRLLASLLRLRAEETAAPEILEQPITAPIVITGMPRSGTTSLHRLLAEDPANLVPCCWQTIYPYPDRRCQDGAGDRRPERVTRQLRRFALLAPDFRSVHPLDSWSPQECSEITAHIFRSRRFDSTHEIPAYRRWLDAHGHDTAYRFHKRFRQHLQHQRPGGRWVLKCPDHVFALGALRAAYPDARVVFVHRDPMKVLASVARLTEILRAPFARSVDRARIGAQVTEDWALGAAIMVDADQGAGFPADQVAHVHYAEIAQRPLATVERLYQRFGLTLEPAARRRMADRVAALPDGGYGRNHYRADAYGIDRDQVEARFRRYVEHFGIVEPTATG